MNQKYCYYQMLIKISRIFVNRLELWRRGERAIGYKDIQLSNLSSKHISFNILTLLSVVSVVLCSILTKHDFILRHLSTFSENNFVLTRIIQISVVKNRKIIGAFRSLHLHCSKILVGFHSVPDALYVYDSLGGSVGSRHDRWWGMVLGMPISEIGCHKPTIWLAFQVNVATNTEWTVNQRLKNEHRQTGKEVQTCSMTMPEVGRHKQFICLQHFKLILPQT